MLFIVGTRSLGVLPLYRTLAGGSPLKGVRWTLRESGPARAGTEGLTCVDFIVNIVCFHRSFRYSWNTFGSLSLW